MTRAAHIAIATAIGIVVLVAFVILITVIRDSMQSDWLCAHHWRSC